MKKIKVCYRVYICRGPQSSWY